MHKPAVDESHPQPFPEQGLLPLLVSWEHRRRQRARGQQILLYPYPDCPACGSAVHEGFVRAQMVALGQHLIAFRPCGHCFTLADDAVARHFDHMQDVVDRQENRPATAWSSR